MMPNSKNSLLIISGVVGFLTVIIYLHTIQIPTGYSPTEQLMSELALGKQGELMLFAFAALAFATIGIAAILSSYQASWLMQGILSIAAVAFAGAGYFTLATAMEVHIALVAVAFIALVLVMYLMPRSIAAFQTLPPKLFCWGLATATALSVALGHSILPIGIAQRSAATCLLAWFCWLALFNLKPRA